MKRFLFSVMAAVCLTGCDGTPQANYGLVDLVDVSGTVTLDGEPLADAVITFDAPDGQFSYGQTDDAGHYVLQFDSVKSGVTTGPKTVRISTTRKLLGLNSENEGGEEATEGLHAKQGKPKELVPDRYNTKSELKEEVTRSQLVYDFDLKSK